MAIEPVRPSPEQFLQLIRRQERGRLKVYLGSNAGVGKTYAMLREGNRLKKQGVDVAIGLVETHGRVETAEQIDNLEVIPKRLLARKRNIGCVIHGLFPRFCASFGRIYA